MRAYALIPMVGGAPVPAYAGMGEMQIGGYCLGAEATSGGGVRWGFYIVAGTLAQIQALDADPGIVAICAFYQLDDVISVAKRAELDAWADAHFPGLPPVPAAWTYRQVVDELFGRANEHYISAGLFLKPLGLAVEHTGIRCLAVAPDPAGLSLGYHGAAWKLLDIGPYGIWELLSDEDELMAVHRILYETVEPGATFGLLGVVQIYGTSFYPRAVMDTFDHPASELIARRDRIAMYLEGLGYSNTGALRAATTEHAQIAGIVAALGYTMGQLWNAMHG